MGKLSSRLKIGMTIFLPNSASKNDFKTSSKISKSTSMQGSTSQTLNKNEYYSLKEESNVIIRDKKGCKNNLESKTTKRGECKYLSCS